MSRSRSRWVITGAVVLVAALLVGRFMGRKQQELSIFNWTEYMPEEILEDFAKEFGVKVRTDTYSSNEDMLAKLTAGASGYDLIVPSDYMVSILRQKGLLAPLDKSLLPNMANLDPFFLNQDFDPGNEYSVPYMWGTMGIAVNTEKVKEKITGWKDLWDSRYKGRIVVMDDPREVTGAALQMLGYSRNSTDPAALEAAKQKLKELMPLVKAFDSDSPKSLLLSGEVDLGMVWNGEAALANMEDPNITYIMPEEGGGIWLDAVAIPSKARNKDLAHEFINYLLRPDVSAKLSEAFPYGNPNKASHALTDPKILSNPASYPSEASLKRAEWIKDVGEATLLYDRIWTEVKGQ